MDCKNFKILVLGGTGAIGSHLVRQMSETGGVGKIWITTRQKIVSQNVNAEYVLGNAHDNAFLEQLLKKSTWDCIVDFMTYTTEEFSSRIENILQSTSQYIYLSSARVYAQSKDLLTEESPRLLDICKDEDYIKTDEYALAKARQEDILRNSKYNNWTIVRPYISFSQNRLQLSGGEKENWLYGALHGRPIFYTKDLADKYTTLTYGEDVAKAIASLIGEKETLCQIYHISSGQSYRWSDVLSVYTKVLTDYLGHSPKIIYIDEWKPLMGGGEYQVRYDRLYNRKFNVSKINRYIDTNTFMPVLTQLADCLESFLLRQRFKNINWIYEAQKDRISGRWCQKAELKTFRQRLKYMTVRLGLAYR